MGNEKLQILDGWEVVAIDGKGMYIRNGKKAWNIASHEQLELRRDELAEIYRDVIG